MSIQKQSSESSVETITAYIIGALRDGYVDERQYLVSIGQKNKEWLEFLRALVKKTFDIDSNIRQFQNAFELRIFSKEFFNYLKSRGVRDGSTTPESIMATKKLWVPYISGFFDAEGHCTSPETFKKTKKKKVSFHQNDKKSLEFIKSVLEENKIKTSEIYLQKGRNCHVLYIQSKDGILKFGSIFCPIRKRKQLDALLSVLPP